MGCISSLSVTVAPERSYWTALIEFMRMRQQSQSLDVYAPRKVCAEINEYADAGIVAANNALDSKTKFSDQEIEDCGYLGWLACAN